MRLRRLKRMDAEDDFVLGDLAPEPVVEIIAERQGDQDLLRIVDDDPARRRGPRRPLGRLPVCTRAKSCGQHDEGDGKTPGRMVPERSRHRLVHRYPRMQLSAADVEDRDSLNHIRLMVAPARVRPTPS